jgi:hypothetical protein
VERQSGQKGFDMRHGDHAGPGETFVFRPAFFMSIPPGSQRQAKHGMCDRGTGNAADDL